MSWSRRAVLSAGGALAVAGRAGVAEARVLPKDMVPLIGPGYRAVDQDEKGMWQLMERVEEEVSGSNLLIKDPPLTAYLGDLIGRVGGPAAKDMRIYLARIPEFNAFMAPTGFMVVKRHVFQAMMQQYPELNYVPDGPPNHPQAHLHWRFFATLGRSRNQRGLCDVSCHRQADAAKQLNPFGDRVDELALLIEMFVEQQVELVEVHALDVPVGLLGLAVQVQGVGQLLVEQGDGLFPNFRGEIVLGCNRSGLCHRKPPSGGRGHPSTPPPISTQEA